MENLQRKKTSINLEERGRYTCVSFGLSRADLLTVNYVDESPNFFWCRSCCVVIGCQNHLIIPLGILCAKFVEVGEVGGGGGLADSEVGRG